MKFIGREVELRSLKQLSLKKSASLVTLQGRRRIGKSSLIEEFGKTKKYFYQFQGLAPRTGIAKQAQLDHFADQLKIQFGESSSLNFSSWTEAFNFLILWEFPISAS